MSQVDDSDMAGQVETKTILKRIISDFEQLDSAIASAIAYLEARGGQVKEIDALKRARAAARKGADLARIKLSFQ